MNDLLKEWQDRLGLQDWVIKLKEDCSPNDMNQRGCSGEAEWVESNKAAIVRICAEKDYGEGCIVPYHPEQTLVHELLHLKFCLLDESGNSLQDRIVHQMVDDFAKALVDAKYHGRSGKHDGCDGCAYEHKAPKEEPCKECKQAYMDRYKRGKKCTSK